MATPHERLMQARQKAGYDSAKSAAEAMGIKVPTYIQHENGIRGFPSSKAERYARFFRVTPEWLLYGKRSESTVVPLGPQLFVIGEVMAGVFSEAWRRDAQDYETFTGRADLPVPAQKRFGLKVAGDSMNLLYPPGTILECRQYEGDEIESGRRVIVERTHVDGRVEATVKEFVVRDDGTRWLVPRSTNPEFQAFRADAPDSHDIESVQIIGVVVGSYRPE